MAEVTIEQAFQIAVQHHQKGELAQAEAIYRQILTQNPKHAGALYHLGMIASQLGHFPSAIELIRQALAMQPANAEAHNNLGYVLWVAGKSNEAIVACRRAISLRPQYAEAYSNLGNALHGGGQFDEAIAAYRQAIAINPTICQAHNNLGNVLKEMGQLDESIAAFRQAIALNHGYAEAWNNLGNSLHAKGQLDEAIAAHSQAISLKPELPQVYSNLGNALRDKMELDKAVAAYRLAIRLKPDFFEAYGNLGNALKDKGELDETIAAYRQSILLHPDSPATHSNLIYTIHFHSGYNARAIAEEHRLWNLRHAQPLRGLIQPHANNRNPDRRLRIGYISPDFSEHVVGRFLLPLLANHNKREVEVFAYAEVAVPDVITERLRSHVDVWQNIYRLSDTDVTNLIRMNQIDILVDLTMHMRLNRMLVFARKPAPVQMTYLAYCSTTGLETIDYRFSDPYLDPPGEDESIYSEQTVRLPDTYWCYEPYMNTPEVGPISALEGGYITFGNLNNFCKISQEALMTWAALMLATPKSRLMLHAEEGSHRQRVWEQMEKEGIERSRIQFVGKVPTRDYFELYKQIDIALDPFPYGGGTTTCDALWMGVPVVSLVGRTGVGRGGLSILSNIGLPELVVRSQDEYVRIAVGLAADLPRLTKLRTTLRQRMKNSPLMDGPRFAHYVENAYRQMWRTWCGKQ